MNEQRQVLTVKVAAAMARFSQVTFRRWCCWGYLDAFQAGPARPSGSSRMSSASWVGQSD